MRESRWTISPRIAIIVLGLCTGVPVKEDTDLAECLDDLSGFAWVQASFRRLRSNIQGAIAQLRLQLGNAEAAEAGFEAASLIDPCSAWLHFNLATLKTKRGDLQGAEISYAAVVQVDPNDQLARLLYDKIRQQGAQAAFWGQLMTVLQDHPEIQINDEGLLDIPTSSQDRVKAGLQAAAAVLEVWAPMRLAMNLDRITDGHLQELLMTDRSEFEKACDGGGRTLAKLPKALQAVRDLENSTKWLIPWAVERLQHFAGPDALMSTGAYGITWFSAWKSVLSRPSVVSAFRQVRSAIVVIVGSSLGYQCFYALALGAKKCIGYEVLCKTLVSHATEIVSKNGLSDSIEYRCEDARRMKGLKEATLVWINDETFPADLRDEVHRKVAADLKPDALAISYSLADGLARLDREDVVRIEVSWSFVASIFILRKLAPGQSRRPPPMPTPQNQRGRRKNRGRLSSMLGNLGNFEL